MVVLNLVSIFKEREMIFSIDEGTTIKEFIDVLLEKYGADLEKRIYTDKEKGQLNLNLYLNGKHIHFLSGLDTVIEDGDTLLFIPFAAGG